MRTTSRRLKRLIEEEEKTISRIEELQEYLKEIREARKKEEDLVIIKSIRSMKLGARDLLDLLTAIQEGNLSEELREQLLAVPEDEEATELASDSAGQGRRSRSTEGTGEGVHDDEGSDPDNDDEGAKAAPEREENNDDRHHN